MYEMASKLHLPVQSPLLKIGSGIRLGFESARLLKTVSTLSLPSVRLPN